MPPKLCDPEDTLAAGYVDNYAVIGLDKSLVTHKANEIRQALEARGLPVHAVEEAADSTVFTGLEILGRQGIIRVRSEKLSTSSVSTYQTRAFFGTTNDSCCGAHDLGNAFKTRIAFQFLTPFTNFVPGRGRTLFLSGQK